MSKGITINLCGGLGNQMFIIAAMLELSIKQGIPYYLPRLDNSPSITRRDTYWSTVFHRLKLCDSQEIPASTLRLKENNPNQVNIFPDNINEMAILEGYFQSSKYFSKEIVSLFSLPEREQKRVDNLWNYVNDGTSVINFIHVRRGDYLHLQHFHFVLSIEWYKKCLKHFSDNDCFLIFSDDPEWCKENFGFIKNKKFISDDDYIELFLMSRCDGAIISNSTFSWWGAKLGKNKKIVAPDVWYRDMFQQKGMRNELDWIEETISIGN